VVFVVEVVRERRVGWEGKCFSLGGELIGGGWVVYGNLRGWVVVFYWGGENFGVMIKLC
jgi:hypothetical protein